MELLFTMRLNVFNIHHILYIHIYMLRIGDKEIEAGIYRERKREKKVTRERYASAREKEKEY